ncbi:GNAT family N-acetyltransferase [Thalassotalea fusca]
MQHPELQQSHCQFATERLRIKHVEQECFNLDTTPTFATQLLKLLTPSVTKELPDNWQNITTVEQAECWWRERIEEGSVLLIKEHNSDEFIGLMFLHDANSPELERKNIHLGYLFKASTWGKGYASELLAGFVLWCEQQGNVGSLIGGVTPQNKASIRVLEKNGFNRASHSEIDGASYFFERQIKNAC